MIIQIDQITKVIQSNYRQQVEMLNNIHKVVSNYSAAFSPIHHQQSEQFLHKWRVLYEENQLLLVKYARHAQNEVHFSFYEQLELAIATQRYILQELGKSTKKWPNLLEKQLLKWSILQYSNRYLRKYNSLSILS